MYGVMIYNVRVTRRPAEDKSDGPQATAVVRRLAVTIEITTTDRRDGKALALFARHDEWMRGHTKDGRPFFAIPGSEPDLLHMADQNDCSCPDRQRNRNVCKHIRSVRLWMAAFMTGAVAPKRGAATADPQDDRIALTPKGAQYLVDVDAVAEHPFVSDLRSRLERRASILRAEGHAPADYRQDAEYAALEAKMLDMQGKVAAVAQRRAADRPMKGYAALMDAHLGD